MFKRLLPLLALVAVYANTSGQKNTISTTAKAERVTVFLNGAEIHSTIPFQASKGITKLIIKNLPSSIDINSLQITSQNDIQLLSINSQSTTRSLDEVSEEAASLLDSIRQLKDEADLINNQIDALNTEKRTLANNENIGGRQTVTPLADIGKAADYFRDRVLRINNAVTKLQNQSDDLNSRKETLQIKLQHLKAAINTDRTDITITFEALQSITSSLNIRYIVADAGWSASYDIIARDITEPVTLKYKALISNETGVPWNNVNITLSTADPTLSATRPYLTPWTLNYTSTANEGVLENRAMGQFAFGDTTSVSEVGVSELNTSFQIPKPYTIPSGNQQYTIDVSNFSLAADYEYLAIPRVDLSAFLLAKIAGWEKLNLIDGTANVYFGNSYIGQSSINTRLISDTLELSLGRDNQILVTRAKLEDHGETRFTSLKRTESFKYELQIKNNRKSPINIKVQDQIPVSQEADIIVETEQLSNATLDARSGKLQWIKIIAASENMKIPIAFSVKYPKNKKVSIRQQRTIRTARYRH